MKLEKIITYQKGKAPQKNFATDELILYLTPEYLRGNSEPTYVSDFSSKVSVDNKDVLLLWDGSNAGEFFIGRKGFLSSTMVKFYFDELKYNREFLFYQLKSFESFLKSQTNGSGIPHVDKEILLGFEVKKFEQPEQTRIVEILSTADEAIEQTEKLIAKYQRIKTGLMQELLTYGIDEQGNIRSKATHKFVVKNGIEVPEEWDVKSLRETCSVIQDGTHFSPPIDDNGEYMYVTSKNIKNGYLDLSDVDFINFTEHQKIYSNCEVRKGDILLTKDGANTGNACLNPLQEEFSLLSSVCILRGKEKILFNEYLLYWLLSESGQRKIKDSMSGLAITRITLTIINEFRIPLPPYDEQIIICDRIKEVYSYLDALNNQVNKLKTIKTGLMQDLLSGRVRVNIKESKNSQKD